jgi:hypothetical protein
MAPLAEEFVALNDCRIRLIGPLEEVMPAVVAITPAA